VPKIPFDQNGGTELIRAAFLQRLREKPDWNSFIAGREDYLANYLDYTGNPELARTRAQMLAHDVFWELVIQNIVAPGHNIANPNLPFFHTTEYGKKVLAEKEFIPHDPDGYLARFRSKNPMADATVIAYLQESVECFARGNHVASVVMLGIASERSFLLLGDTLGAALADPKEQKSFKNIWERFSLKPKLDFVAEKIRVIQSNQSKPFPDNVNLMLSTVCDLIRCQRNDLGHPKEQPPTVSRDEAFVYLRIFPPCYQMTENIRAFLSSNKV
jgi:hypothetical protein